MTTILLIDDSAPMRLSIRKMLEAEGYAVSEAEDGAAGLSQFRALNPSLVICDLMMPDVNGFDAIREMRRLAPAAKIIVISGALFGVADHAVMMERLGLAAIIEKPFR